MSDIDTALKIAAAAHAGQTDRAGQPYILHPLRLMLAAKDPAAQIVALLHDVVEDSPITLDDLATAGFSAAILAAVDALTRRPDEDYSAFIQRLQPNPLATQVKLLDLYDNLNVLRLPQPLTTDDLERLNKYRQALAVLTQ